MDPAEPRHATFVGNAYQYLCGVGADAQRVGPVLRAFYGGMPNDREALRQGKMGLQIFSFVTIAWHREGSYLFRVANLLSSQEYVNWASLKTGNAVI